MLTMRKEAQSLDLGNCRFTPVIVPNSNSLESGDLSKGERGCEMQSCVDDSSTEGQVTLPSKRARRMARIGQYIGNELGGLDRLLEVKSFDNQEKRKIKNNLEYLKKYNVVTYENFQEDEENNKLNNYNYLDKNQQMMDRVRDILKKINETLHAKASNLFFRFRTDYKILKSSANILQTIIQTIYYRTGKIQRYRAEAALEEVANNNEPYLTSDEGKVQVGDDVTIECICKDQSESFDITILRSYFETVPVNTKVVLADSMLGKAIVGLKENDSAMVEYGERGHNFSYQVKVVSRQRSKSNNAEEPKETHFHFDTKKLRMLRAQYQSMRDIRYEHMSEIDQYMYHHHSGYRLEGYGLHDEEYKYGNYVSQFRDIQHTMIMAAGREMIKQLDKGGLYRQAQKVYRRSEEKRRMDRLVAQIKTAKKELEQCSRKASSHGLRRIADSLKQRKLQEDIEKMQTELQTLQDSDSVKSMKENLERTREQYGEYSAKRSDGTYTSRQLHALLGQIRETTSIHPMDSSSDDQNSDSLTDSLTRKGRHIQSFYPKDWQRDSEKRGGVSYSSNARFGGLCEYDEANIRIAPCMKLGSLDKGTLFHELGHWYGHVHPEINLAARYFFNRRTVGRSAQNYWLMPGRKYLDGDFAWNYIGILYGDDDRDGAEVPSVGCQGAFRHRNLALKDEDMLAFIYGMLALL